MKGQYVIVDLRNMEYFKDKENKIIYFNTEEEARERCWIYEFENAWVMKLIYNHIEAE